MKRCILVFSLVLAGCAAGPLPEDMVRGLNKQWAGRTTEEFFVTYGKPVGKVQPDVVGVAYRWVSILPPQTPGEVHNFVAHGKTVGFVEPGSDTLEPRYCEMEIQADRKDIIHGIVMRHDDIGKRSNSLCGEIFGSR
jgi:hypothetical protein